MISLRRPAFAATLIAGSLLVTSCATTGSGGTTDDAADDTRTVTTDLGAVEIPADPQRIVVLNSNLAGYLYALDQPVLAVLSEGVGTTDTEFPEFWADEAEADGTEILPWPEDGFAFEEILALDPDLIVAGGQGYSSVVAQESYERLTDIAPTVIVSPELTDWQGQLSYIADDIFGDAEGGQALLDAYDARVDEVTAAITVPELPVAYLITTPDGTPFSVPESAALPQTLAAVGFEPAPVIADNPGFETYGTGDSFELSTEQLSAVLTAPSMFAFRFFDGEGDDLAALKANPAYAALPAFKNDQVWELPAWVYRADYLRTMALLDLIEEQFS